MRGLRYKSVFETSARKKIVAKVFFVQENCFKYTGLNITGLKIKIHQLFFGSDKNNFRFF